MSGLDFNPFYLLAPNFVDNNITTNSEMTNVFEKNFEHMKILNSKCDKIETSNQ